MGTICRHLTQNVQNVVINYNTYSLSESDSISSISSLGRRGGGNNAISEPVLLTAELRGQYESQ